MAIKQKIFYGYVVTVILLLSACATTKQTTKHLTINALMIENHSSSELNNVKIKVEQTGAYASCGLVLRGSACSTTFKTKVYQGNPVFISWEHDGKRHKVGPLYGDEPANIQTGIDAAVVVAFVSADNVTVKFRY